MSSGLAGTIKRIAVVGSRTFNDVTSLERELSKFRPEIIVSGGSKGADQLAEKYAAKHGLLVEIYEPDWRLGRGAGLIRNTEIVKNADLIIAFWDGKSRGTLDSIKKAEKMEKPVVIVRF